MDDLVSLSEHDAIFCAYKVQTASRALWCRSILFVYPESNQTVLVATVHSLPARWSQRAGELCTAGHGRFGQPVTSSDSS